MQGCDSNAFIFQRAEVVATAKLPSATCCSGEHGVNHLLYDRGQHDVGVLFGATVICVHRSVAAAFLDGGRSAGPTGPATGMMMSAPHP